MAVKGKTASKDLSEGMKKILEKLSIPVQKSVGL
jgi:hypothetical protein